MENQQINGQQRSSYASTPSANGEDNFQNQEGFENYSSTSGLNDTRSSFEFSQHENGPEASVFEESGSTQLFRHFGQREPIVSIPSSQLVVTREAEKAPSFTGNFLELIGFIGGTVLTLKLLGRSPQEEEELKIRLKSMYSSMQQPRPISFGPKSRQSTRPVARHGLAPLVKRFIPPLAKEIGNRSRLLKSAAVKQPRLVGLSFPIVAKEKYTPSLLIDDCFRKLAHERKLLDFQKFPLKQEWLLKKSKLCKNKASLKNKQEENSSKECSSLKCKVTLI